MEPCLEDHVDDLQLNFLLMNTDVCCIQYMLIQFIWVGGGLAQTLRLRLLSTPSCSPKVLQFHWETLGMRCQPTKRLPGKGQLEGKFCLCSQTSNLMPRAPPLCSNHRESPEILNPLGHHPGPQMFSSLC